VGNSSFMRPAGTRPGGSPAVGNRTLLLGVLCAISSQSPAANVAQTTDSASPLLQEIIVTAQKREENLQDVPVPVSVLNTDKLADNGQVLLRDYYTAVPGLNVTPNYSADQNVSIRGISTGGFSTPTVGILVDDVPYGGSIDATAGNQVPDFDPGDLARIEVLRGPQGTLYGANSMGGLVKYVTVDPSTDQFSGRVQAGTDGVYHGDIPGYDVRGSINAPLGDRVAARASTFVRRDPGYIDNPVLGLSGVNEITAAGGRLALMWRPLENLSLKLSGLYQDTRGHGVSEVDLLPGLAALQQNYVAGAGRFDKRIQAYSATLKATLGAVNLISITGYNINKVVDSLDYTPIAGFLTEQKYGVTGSPYTDYKKISKLTQEVRLSASIGPRFEWLLGGFFTREGGPGSDTLAASNPATGEVIAQSLGLFSPNSVFQEFAGFTDLTYHVNDQFDIQLGGRESHLKETIYARLYNGAFAPLFLHVADPTTIPAIGSSDNAFTYLVTPRLKLAPDLMIYARLASGYRPGSPNALVPGSPPKSSPDKTANYEFGLKGDFLDHSLSIDASIFHIDWKDIQIQLRNANGVVYSANGGKAKSEGIELSATERPLNGLSISGWVAYDNAVLTQALPTTSTAVGADGDRLPDSTRFSGNLSAQQNFPLWSGTDGFVGASFSYVGDREGTFLSTPERQRFPSYTKTDLRAGIKYDTLTANLYVNNVTDQRGVIEGGLGYVYPFAFVYIQPRTVGLSIAKTF
jgi:iron complex outermembrane receptor protein